MKGNRCSLEKWSTLGLEKQIYLMSLKYLVAENKDIISKLMGTYGNNTGAGFKKTMTVIDHNSLNKQGIHESIIKSHSVEVEPRHEEFLKLLR